MRPAVGSERGLKAQSGILVPPRSLDLRNIYGDIFLKKEIAVRADNRGGNPLIFLEIVESICWFDQRQT